jgi:hypothetical protein
MSMGNGQEVEHIGYDVLENPPNPMYSGCRAWVRMGIVCLRFSD